MTDQGRLSTEALKREAVRLVTDQGDGVAAAARHLGRHARRRGRWTRAGAPTMTGALPRNGRVALDQEAVDHWRDEHRRVQRERDLLTNARGFLASESR